MSAGPAARLAAALADRYRLERELGQGGMATVWLAEDLRHRRKVAVKVLRPELATALGPDRFLREIEVAAQLHHPHILPLYGSGEADGFLFYVMPYEAGQSLRERLERETELPVRDVVRLLHDIADALSHAHQHGLVHRDIKPENVMLSGRHALVTDFGVAKAVSDATGRANLTTVGVALGTPVYMAPEQAMADPNIDHRADIYALGVLAYELLTGQPPFTGASPQAIIAAHVTQAPVPVSQIRTAVPPALAALVMRCLEKKPADRFQSAEELLPALEALGTPSGGTTPFETSRYEAAAPRSRRRVAYAAGALVLLPLLAWGGLRLARPAPLDIRLTNIRQVTREPAVEFDVALSPDGREVAYASREGGKTSIIVRDVAGGRPLPLTADWPGLQFQPRWMPDGRAIVFINAQDAGGRQPGPWKMPRLGGQAIAVDSSDTRALFAGLFPYARGDTFAVLGADGRVRVMRAGVSEVHSLQARQDGGAVAFVVGNADYQAAEGNVSPSAVWVTPVGGTAVRVTDSTSLNVSPAWLPDGTLLFVSNRDGPRDIYAVRLDRAGHPREPPVRLTTGLEALSVSVSGDGKTLAYERFILRRNIRAVPIPQAGSVSLRDARAVTTGNQTIENLDLSLDGTTLTFDSNLDGRQAIYVMPAAGGEPRRVTRSAGDDFSPDFSPDGRDIAFHSTRNGTRDIYVIHADGSGEQRLSSDSAQSYNATFSPDGLAIAWADLPWNPLRIARRARLDAPWQPPQPLDSLTGFGPRWSPDGREFAFMAGDRGAGIAIHAVGGRTRMLSVAATAGLRDVGWPEWSADGGLIYFRAIAPDGVEGVYQVAASGGTPRLLVRFDEPSLSVYPGAVTVGNGQFYFAVGEIESDIYVTELVQK
jgi:serine/threonine-protein kinase